MKYREKRIPHTNFKLKKFLKTVKEYEEMKEVANRFFFYQSKNKGIDKPLTKPTTNGCLKILKAKYLQEKKLQNAAGKIFKR